MESFYGGRQGAPFTIVKHFDGIDIPQTAGNYVYKQRIYAVNANGDFILNSNGQFIEQNESNIGNYAWKNQALDGSTVNVVTAQGTSSTKTLDRDFAEGMRQCFEQGSATTNIVNYDNYVIIDTIVNLNKTDSLDNGKIFRRGYNSDYNAETNPLAGAEYIGQVVGPKGATGGLHIIGNVDSVDELINAPEVMFGNAEYAGWAMTVNDIDIYTYDYNRKKWYRMGTLDVKQVQSFTTEQINALKALFDEE